MRGFDRIYCLMALLLLFCGCKKEEVAVDGGSFSFRGGKYPLAALRIEHIGYAPSVSEPDSCVISVMAYPATFKKSESSSSGYGAVLNLLFSAPDFRLSDGEYPLMPQWRDSLNSCLTIYPADKSDTLVYSVNSGMMVKTDEEYKFALTTDDGDEITGEYSGDVTYNFSVDKPECGILSFDTISCYLAEPVVYDWDNLFSSETSYREFVFYSTDSRFTDGGKIRNGVQFVLGFNLDNEKNMPVGEYAVTNDFSRPNTLAYGHKVSNTAWGSYWQVFRNGSAAGKANILSESLTIDKYDEKNISLTFTFTDQLNNTVTGEYNGGYEIYKKNDK